MLKPTPLNKFLKAAELRADLEREAQIRNTSCAELSDGPRAKYGSGPRKTRTRKSRKK